MKKLPPQYVMVKFKPPSEKELQKIFIEVMKKLSLKLSKT
jgi:hypothetical protein